MGFDAGVVICTHNRAALLGRTLDSLAAAAAVAAAMGPSCEVIVVDNNSTDETDALVRAAHHVERGQRDVFLPRQFTEHITGCNQPVTGTLCDVTRESRLPAPRIAGNRNSVKILVSHAFL